MSILSLTLLTFLALPTWADPLRRLSEVQQHDRVEFQVGRKDYAQVVTDGVRGLAILHHDAGDRAGAYRVLLLDSQFQERGAFDLYEPGAQVSGYEVVGDELVVVLRDPRASSFAVARVPLDGASEPTVLRLDSPLRKGSFDELVVVDGHAYIDAHKRSDDHLFHIPLDQGGPVSEIALPSATGATVFLQRLAGSWAGDQVDVVTMETKKRRRTLTVHGVTDGQLRSSLLVEPRDGQGNLLTAQRSRLDDGSEVVVGTYAATEKATGAQGLYVARYAEGRLEGASFHSFSDFTGFFEHLSERRQQRLERKKDALEASGEDLRMSVQVLMHDLIEQPERLIAVGEVYYPVYHTTTTTTTSTVNGVTTTTTTTHTVFDGFRTSHAFVAALDRQGELLWENSFPMDYVLSYKLRERISIQPQGDQVVMRYAFGSRVSRRTVVGDEVVGQDQEQAIGASDHDEVKANWDTMTEEWTDDSFLLWGFQRVKDEEEGRTTVFFVSRIDG